MATKSIKGSLVEFTKFRNSSEVFALIDELELDLDPARNEKRISRSRKQSYRRTHGTYIKYMRAFTSKYTATGPG